MSNGDTIVSSGRVESLILSIRGRRVILDSDLARLYGVTTARLNEQVKRNRDRFPADFMFALSQQEFTDLISQNATSRFWGGRRKLPHVFTEHGAIMAANVLNSGRAIEVSVFVVRAFVRLRELTVVDREVARRLDELDRKVAGHDEAIRSLVQAIRQLMAPPERPRRSIGFKVEEGRPRYRVKRPGRRAGVWKRRDFRLRFALGSLAAVLTPRALREALCGLCLLPAAGCLLPAVSMMGIGLQTKEGLIRLAAFRTDRDRDVNLSRCGMGMRDSRRWTERGHARRADDPRRSVCCPLRAACCLLVLNARHDFERTSLRLRLGEVSVIRRVKLSPGLESCGAEWPMSSNLTGMWTLTMPVLFGGSAFHFLDERPSDKHRCLTERA